MRRKLGKRLAGIHGLLDSLGAYMLFANESNVLHYLHPSGLLTTEDAEAFAAAAAEADVDLLLGSTDDESRAFLPPDQTASTTGAQHRVYVYAAAAQHGAAEGAGSQMRRNAEHFSGALRRRWWARTWRWRTRYGCGCMITAGRHSERRV
ncbi:hypothetical protein EDB89DRAFT_2245282 [Lactarius sanguifluus]|nr:hypothetical protein EDB89DRAFT_2245282 [Lactarius sanguifluus]